DGGRKSIEIFESIADLGGELRCLQTNVGVSRKFGEFYKSIAIALRGLDVADRFAPEPREVWPFYHQIAMDFKAVGFPPIALDFEMCALRLAFESKTPLLKSRSYEVLASIYQALHNYPEMLKNGELALAEARAVDSPKTRADMMASSTLN